MTARDNLDEIIKRHGEPIYRFVPGPDEDEEGYDPIPTEIVLFDMKREGNGRIMACHTYGKEWYVNGSERHVIRHFLHKMRVIEDLVPNEHIPYTCYMESQGRNGRCKKHCGNNNYCERKEVCDKFVAGKVNWLVCQNCTHTQNQH